MNGRDIADRVPAVLIEGPTPARANHDEVTEVERRLNVTLDADDESFHVFIIGGAGGANPIATTFSGFVELILAADPKLHGQAE